MKNYRRIKRADMPEMYMGKDTGIKPMPTFNIGSDDLPELKDWTVGDEYELAIRVKFTSHTVDYDNDNDTHGNLQIEAIKVLDEDSEGPEDTDEV